MNIIRASQTQNLQIGRVGENDCTQVVFDMIADWMAEYPAAVIGLYNLPPRAEQAYPVANVQQTENFLHGCGIGRISSSC